MPPSKVFRSVSTPEVELRFTEVRATLSSSGEKRIEGYAATFGTRADLPGFKETIKPGAFRSSIANKGDVVALWNHNSDLPLGRTTSGTLRLDEDSKGLHYICDLPNTSWGKDAYESIKRGDINGCSFGFTVDNDGQSWSEDTDADGRAFVLRTITNAKLLDVSPVTYPAYGGTKVTARAVEVPAELRSRVAAKNGLKMPSHEELLAITRRSQDRKKQEQDAAEQVRRRKDFVRQFLLG